jgi:hypothetical protein
MQLFEGFKPSFCLVGESLAYVEIEFSWCTSLASMHFSGAGSISFIVQGACLARQQLVPPLKNQGHKYLVSRGAHFHQTAS